MDKFKLFAVLGLLGFGALNTLTTKIQFTVESVGTNGQPKAFTKPFFATFTMFVAMSFVTFWEYARAARERRAAPPRDDGYSLLGHEKPAGPSELKSFLLVGIPATFDLVATCLMFFGLLYMSASIYQMLRGAMIVFSAMISVPLLGKKLYAYHWIGVGICVVGIACVGASTVLNEGSGTSTGPVVTPEESMMGIVLVLLAQVVQAAQVVVEEKFLREVDIPPFKIVGFEGIWGTFECIFIIFPALWMLKGNDNGHFEDTIDTFVMIGNSGPLLALVLVYLFSCSTYNAAGIAVTSSFSAVMRTMLEASRTAVIWGFDLIIHLVNPQLSFGEAWLPYSWLQLVGFVVLLTGQSIYGEVIRIPGLYYPPAQNVLKPQFESPKLLLSGASPLPRDIQFVEK